MSKPTLSEYLAQVKARCWAALPGPWVAEEEFIAAQVAGGRPNGEIIAMMSGSADHLSVALRKANAEFAAQARTDVEALVGMVEAFWDYEGYPEDNLPCRVESLIPERSK